MARYDKRRLLPHLAVFFTVILSSGLFTLYFVSSSKLIQWLLLIFVAAGVYFFVDRLLEVIFKGRETYNHQVRSIFYNEILHQVI